ncbi:MAG: TetR/AcrR family transcriptional regulator [Desulfobacterales bacterium]|jgi:TetR/AcrR family transcriptional regulator|nr:TetR/AcrR family transcriptional regulator [Desulfobacteraceae bacterium]MBT7084700.1 TetR/AcrR family transcriptional regulator [Desulfobacterales bacterium]MBT7697474.1 TetR/AcrR family transcriptional regulator [Desulfobacterales bacterium]
MAKKNKRYETSSKILKAATQVFSEVGFAGARVDEIAQRAGVNKATIYYNTGDKKTLYARVLQKISGEMYAHPSENIEKVLTPVGQLKAYVRNIANVIDRNPALPNIILWEHASGGKNFPEEASIEIAKMIEMLINILKEGEKQDIFIKTSPILIQFMIMGSFMLYKTSNPIRKMHTAFPREVKKSESNLSGTIADEIEKYILKAVKKEN